MDAKAREKEHFDGIAGDFDHVFNAYGKKAGIMRVERRIRLFLSHCRLSPGDALLELGCGTGEYSVRLTGIPVRFFCTDISLNMAKAAAGKAGKVSFFVSDIEKLPARDEAFDAVVGNSVLHHADAAAALKEVMRVLKKGGRCAFSEPNMRNPYVFLQKNIPFFRRLSGDSPGETAFFRARIGAIMKEAGFRNVRVLPFDFLYPRLPDPVAVVAARAGQAVERIPLAREFAGSLLITGEK